MAIGLVLVAIFGMLGCMVLYGMGKAVPEGFITIVGGAVGALGGAYVAHPKEEPKP